jgi:hypothetical protein
MQIWKLYLHPCIVLLLFEGVHPFHKPVRSHQQGVGPHMVKGTATGPQAPNLLYGHSVRQGNSEASLFSLEGQF